MSEPKPFITCHVLDTGTGKPAAGLHVSLSIVGPNVDEFSGDFDAVTDSNGRVTAWGEGRDTDLVYNMTMKNLINHAREDQKLRGQLIWKLRFKTGDYYGSEKTFWPEVELCFTTQLSEEHYHVPLLLGPYSYTTYRGS